MKIQSDVLEFMLTEAQRAHPEECCGILLGENDCVTTVLPAANRHPEPRRHFEIDPQALIAAHRAAREGGLAVIGYYHSHPTTAAEPSQADAALAAHDGLVWAIIGQGNVTFWRDLASGFEPLSYSAVEA